MKEIICGRKLVKFFGEGSEKRKVLDEVDVSVAKGEFLSVMGPSGSGEIHAPVYPERHGCH